MHYYSQNIADYRKDTGHLSHLEHGIYRQLMDSYYLEEKPIQAKNIARKMSIRAENEEQALQNVLEDFFSLSDCGEFYTHKRIDAEIAKYKAKADQARVNGKKGGRPQKPTETQGVNSGLPTETQPVISGNPDVTQTKANSLTHELNNSVTQEPSNSGTKELGNLGTHEPENPETKSSSSKPLSGNPDVTHEIIDYLNQATGKKFRHVKTHADFIKARLAEGHTVEDLKSVVKRKTAEWQGTNSAQYLRPATLFNAEKFNQYIGEIGQPLPNALNGKKTESIDEFKDRATAAGERLQARLQSRNTNQEATQ